MTLPQREHPAARAELRAAVRWYDDAATGQELLDASRSARTSIADLPSAWPPVPDWARLPVVRRKGIAGFPYNVIYYVSDNEIVIVAYAHEKRRPNYWRDRVEAPS